MTLEQICTVNDISVPAAATALANLIEKGLVQVEGESAVDAVTRLRAQAKACIM